MINRDIMKAIKRIYKKRRSSMTYQENYQKWLDFAELPDYLRQDLENMDEKMEQF